MNPFDRLLAFLERLREAKISYSLAHNSYNGVMVLIAVPGQRWEVEFLNDGGVEVERFLGNGYVEDASALDELFAKFSD